MPKPMSQLAKLINRRIDELRPRKTQKDIAAIVGFENPNMITMVKQGTSKLALERVTLMAKALEYDPAHLMRLTLVEQLGADVAKDIESLLGFKISSNEREILTSIRKMSGNTDPGLTAKANAYLTLAFGSGR